MTRLPEFLKSLNTSLAQSAAELWLTQIYPDRAYHAFRGTSLYLSNIGFLNHNFGSRNAGMPIKAL